MSTKRKFTIGGLATLVLVLMMVIPWTVLADNTVPDGDDTTPVAANPLNFGTICVGQESSKSALVAISRNGSATGTNTFHNSASVAVSVQSTVGTGLTSTMDSTTITLPSNWTGLANNTLSDSVSATVKLTPGATGSFSGSVTFRATGLNTGGNTINRDATMSVTATVNDCTPADTTPPDISYVLNPASPDGSNGWYTGDVTLTWTVTENESPSSLVKTGCVDQNITADQQEMTYSCSATSDGGSAGPVSVSIKRDATVPEINASLDPSSPSASGWYNISTGSPTVSFTCNDATSGVADPPGCPDDYTFLEGASQSHSGTAYDNAGNSNSDGVSGINVDLTAPSISGAPTTSPNGAGWYKNDVTIQWTCSDSLSGIDVGSCPADSTISSEGTNLTAHESVSDKAGNSAETDSSPAVNIDKTAPVVSLVGGPTDGGFYYFGFVPAAPTCSASDGLSGLDGACSVSGYSAAVGAHTVTATATDKAGNTSSASASYTVSAWTLSGFYQPVDMNGVLNTVKGGATVPLKFEVFAGSTELTDTSVVKSLTASVATCDSGATTDDIEATATGGTSLRYDTTSGQFIYNWQTPKQPGKCYKVVMTTQDGSTLSALFKLK